LIPGKEDHEKLSAPPSGGSALDDNNTKNKNHTITGDEK